MTGQRVFLQPPRWGKTVAGRIIGEKNDVFGHFIRVQLEGSSRTILVRESDLERECSEGGGGPHEWDDGICVKCWEERG